jgi:hypothetical protein
MRKILIAVLAAGIGLAGSAAVALAALLSATGERIAKMVDDLFAGEA